MSLQCGILFISIFFLLFSSGQLGFEINQCLLVIVSLFLKISQLSLVVIDSLIIFSFFSFLYLFNSKFLIVLSIITQGSFNLIDLISTVFFIFFNNSGSWDLFNYSSCLNIFHSSLRHISINSDWSLKISLSLLINSFLELSILLSQIVRWVTSVLRSRSTRSASSWRLIV